MCFFLPIFIFLCPLAFVLADPLSQFGFFCTNASPNPSFGCQISTQKLSFFAVGDIGGKEEKDGTHRTTEGQRKVANLMGKVAEKAGIGGGLHFVLNLGDNFYEHGVTFKDVEQRFEQNFLAVYGHIGTEQMPWYTIAGNNDHKSPNGIMPQIQNPTGKWTFPAPFYSVRYTFGPYLDVHVRLIMIDSTILCGKSRKEFTDERVPEEVRARKKELAEEHFEWLERELVKANQLARKTGGWGVDFLFVAGHYPCYVTQGDRAFGCSKRLQCLLREHRVNAYFAGHEHNLKLVMVPEEHEHEKGHGPGHEPGLIRHEPGHGPGPGYGNGHVPGHETGEEKEHEKGRGLRPGHEPFWHGPGLAQIVSGAGSRMEKALYKNHVPKEYQKLVKFWYPDIVGDHHKDKDVTVMNGGGFVAVDLDSESLEATIKFYAAGHFYPSKNWILHEDKGEFEQTFKLKKRKRN